MRKTILLALTLFIAALSVPMDNHMTAVAGKVEISAATQTYAALFQRFRNHRKSVPETAPPAAKPA